MELPAQDAINVPAFIIAPSDHLDETETDGARTRATSRRTRIPFCVGDKTRLKSTNGSAGLPVLPAKKL